MSFIETLETPADLDAPIVEESAPRTAPSTSGTSARVLEQPTAPLISVTFESVVVGDVAESLWQAYRANFEALEELAILQHMFPREEVLAEFADPSITKIVGWEGDTPV